MGLRRIIEPAQEPVSLAEAKLWCRLDADLTADDGVVSGLVKAAREYVEKQTGRALITQTWRLTLDGWPCGSGALILPRPPLLSVASAKHIDTEGVLTTLDSSAYVVDLESEPGWLVPAYGTSWPTARGEMNAVRIEYQAGYGASGADVPESLRLAMRLLVTSWYEHRGDTSEIPAAVPPLLAPFWTGEYD